MDITSLFTACVKAIKTRNKALGIGDSNSSRILHTSGEFAIRAKQIVATTTHLKEFLIDNKSRYLGKNSTIDESDDSLTSVEREQIDAGGQKIMKTCNLLIRELAKEIDKDSPNPQTREHRSAVLEILQTYIKAVCSIHSKQRAIRVKRAIDRQKLSRLEPTVKIAEESNLSGNLSIEKEELPVKTDAAVDYSLEQEEESGLTPDEIQMFERENSQMYNELNTLIDEVRQIEGKVVKIAELQEIFTEKVLEQEGDINRISNMAVGSTDNVKDANEQLREAIKQNAGFRVWVLFFICVLSFSLLFLDWYND